MRAIDADYFSAYLDAEDQEMYYSVEVKDMISEQPTIEPPANWTPCSVALPTRLGHADWEIMKFICTISNGAVTPLEWEEKIVRGKTIKRWRWSNGGICEYAVIAWKPLPEPYRGEE